MDIKEHLGELELKTYEFLEVISNTLMTGSFFTLKVESQDSVQSVYEYTLDTLNSNGKYPKINKLLEIDISPILDLSTFTNELTKEIIEIVMFNPTNQNVTVMDLNNNLTNDYLHEALREQCTMLASDLIEKGIITGSDIVHFINLDDSAEYIYKLTMNLFRELVDSLHRLEYNQSTLLMIGWTHTNSMVLLTYDEITLDKEKTNER